MAKAPGSDVVIYTVQVNTGGDPLQTTLRDCASSEDTEPKAIKFFMLTSGDQVVTTGETKLIDGAAVRVRSGSRGEGKKPEGEPGGNPRGVPPQKEAQP